MWGFLFDLIRNMDYICIMKRLILMSIVFLSSCTSKYNYKITDDNGDVYLCNFYNKNDDGCILFNDKPGYSNEHGYPTRLCGEYRIKKLK